MGKLAITGGEPLRKTPFTTWPMSTKEELQASSHPRIRQFLDRVPDPILENANHQSLERYLQGGAL